mmetsp:Transcript_19632/g.46620  ORF Transcript_19632/g.46620 Transcript_19632/m.46620 type:complete len:389 (+) Transcript_19632:217-1383(+)
MVSVEDGVVWQLECKCGIGQSQVGLNHYCTASNSSIVIIVIVVYLAGLTHIPNIIVVLFVIFFLGHGILHFQIVLIKQVQPHVSVFSSTRITSSSRIDIQSINGPKMSLNRSKFFLVDQMKKARFKLSHLARRGGDTHGFLPATQQDVFLVVGNDGIIDWSVRRICLQVLPIDCIKQFAGKVGRRCNEKRLVAIESAPINFLFVSPKFFLDISSLGIVQFDDTIVKRYQNSLVQCCPVYTSGIHALAHNFGQLNFQLWFRVDVVNILNFINANLAIVFHKGIGNGGKLTAARRPRHAAHGSNVGKRCHAFARFHLPQSHRGIGRGRQQIAAHSVAIQIPNGPLVTVKGSQPIAIVGPPHGRNVIFGGGKEQVAVIIELNGGNGTFVSL